MAFALACYLWPSFWRSFPWLQLCRISENARWGVLAKFAIARLYKHFGSSGLQQNVVLCLHLKSILVRRWCHLRQAIFCGLLFGGVSLGRNFAELQKMHDEGVLAKFAIARLCGHFVSRGLQQNVVLCLHFKCILIRRWLHLRQGAFSGLLFGGVSLGQNFAEFQKMRDDGVLAKFAIARLYWHFGSRDLQQNVVLCLHFKCILIRRWWHLRQGVFCGLLFGGVSPGRNFAEFQKTRAGGQLGKFDIARLHGHFKRRGLQQNVVLGWHLKEIISEDMMAFAPGCFFWFSFCRSLPWSQLCRISENARWGSPWQIWHSSAPRAL